MATLARNILSNTIGDRNLVQAQTCAQALATRLVVGAERIERWNSLAGAIMDGDGFRLPIGIIQDTGNRRADEDAAVEAWTAWARDGAR